MNGKAETKILFKSLVAAVMLLATTIACSKMETLSVDELNNRLGDKIGNASLVITSGNLTGEYDSVEAVAQRADDLKLQNCVRLNGCLIHEGFGPCEQLQVTYNVTVSPICSATPPVTPPAPPAPVTPPPSAPPVVPPTSVNPPPVSGGALVVSDGSLMGSYPNIAALVSRANQIGMSQCIFVNSCRVKEGFGPCYQISAPSYNVAADPACAAVTPPAPPVTPPPSAPPVAPPVPPVAPPSPPPTGANQCSQFSDVRVVDVPFGGGTPIYTRNHFPFASDTIIAGRFTVPANFPLVSTGQAMSVSEYGGPPVWREVTLSPTPCDFRPMDVTGTAGPMARGWGISASVYYGIAPNARDAAKLVPGRTYYLNVRNKMYDGSESCLISSCDAIMTINTPQ